MTQYVPQYSKSLLKIIASFYNTIVFINEKRQTEVDISSRMLRLIFVRKQNKITIMETEILNIPMLKKSSINRPAGQNSQPTQSSCCSPKNQAAVCCSPSQSEEENDGACCAQPDDGSACCDK